jgi:hypothetical protein
MSDSSKRLADILARQKARNEEVARSEQAARESDPDKRLADIVARQKARNEQAAREQAEREAQARSLGERRKRAKAKWDETLWQIRSFTALMNEQLGNAGLSLLVQVQTVEAKKALADRGFLDEITITLNREGQMQSQIRMTLKVSDVGHVTVTYPGKRVPDPPPFDLEEADSNSLQKLILDFIDTYV